MVLHRLRLSLVLAGLLHSGAVCAEDPLTIFPDRLGLADEATLLLPPPVPKNVAIITPDRAFLFLRDPDFYMSPLLTEYGKSDRITFAVSKLAGQVWVDGEPHIRPVFSTTGLYEFYFADNLETEPGNTFSLCIKIWFDPMLESRNPQYIEDLSMKLSAAPSVCEEQ